MCLLRRKVECEPLKSSRFRNYFVAIDTTVHESFLFSIIADLCPKILEKYFGKKLDTFIPSETKPLVLDPRIQQPIACNYDLCFVKDANKKNVNVTNP